MQCCISSIHSQIYVARSKKFLGEDLKSMKMGSPEKFTNFINAVIDEKSFDKIAKYIDHAKNQMMLQSYLEVDMIRLKGILSSRQLS